jgi:glycine cleavage system aminomethyltransferase T
MSLAFLSVAAADGVVARSPMERLAAAAGARFDVRGGWNVAVSYPGENPAAGGWADVSHLRKIELHGAPAAALELATATWLGGAWWCPLSAERTLVIGGDGELGEHAGDARPVDVTSNYGALAVCGPAAREIFSRFTAIDVREASLPVGGLRPGSIARTPGVLVREAPARFLMLFGWALGEYMWTVVADAAQGTGAGPLGVGALPAPGVGGA